MTTRPHYPEHREFTALADGTLSGRRRRRLEERIANEPRLRHELDLQRFAVAALRSADVAAPAGLRARIEAERERYGRRKRRPKPRQDVALGGARIGYTVVSGQPLDPPEGAAATTHAGTRLSFRDDRGRGVVAWERGGLTCILSGQGVPRDVLVDLAGGGAGG